MKFKFENVRWLALVVVMVFLLPATVLAVPITVPTTLNPGDQYRLAFVTSDTRDATSTDIADYNAFVQGVANSVAKLAGITWTAIGSTPTIHARDNTSTVPGTEPGSFAGIFLLNDTKVVDSYSDLWDGSLDSALNVTESGSTLNCSVWTGTGLWGFRSGFELGSYHHQTHSYVVDFGQSEPFFSPSEWVINPNPWDGSNLKSLYALSDVLTVQSSSDPIPEPSTLVLFGLGFLGLVGYVVRRKRRLSD